MASSTQFACKHSSLSGDWLPVVDMFLADDARPADRTLKGIGLVTADPTYEPLPGFQRYEDTPDAFLATDSVTTGPSCVLPRRTDLICPGPREIFVAVPIHPAAGTLLGPRLKSESI